ncbi:MAG: YtxH domain-containing protein [Bacteroidota bacterium]
MRKNSISISTLLLGAIVGLVGGVLFAPSSGTNVRKVLSYRVKNYIAKLQELVQALSHTKAVVSSQAKDAGQEVVDETIDKAKQLLKDANELAAQLE